MTIACTVKLQFCAAKRLLDYKGACNRLHGYGHVAELSFGGTDNGDIVVDFYEAKRVIGQWLDDNWDHNVLLNEADRPLGKAIADLTGQKVFYFPGDPTAERLALYLKEEVCPRLLPSVRCLRVRLYDSPDAFVEVGDGR